jgi:hypothetical protein
VRGGRDNPVDDHAILNQLEELADNLGVKIRYEILKRDVGLRPDPGAL